MGAMKYFLPPSSGMFFFLTQYVYMYFNHAERMFSFSSVTFAFQHWGNPGLNEAVRARRLDLRLFCLTSQPPPFQELILCAEAGIQPLRGSGSASVCEKKLFAKSYYFSPFYPSLCGTICLTTITIPAA